MHNGTLHLEIKKDIFVCIISKSKLIILLLNQICKMLHLCILHTILYNVKSFPRNLSFRFSLDECKRRRKEMTINSWKYFRYFLEMVKTFSFILLDRFGCPFAQAQKHFLILYSDCRYKKTARPFLLET